MPPEVSKLIAAVTTLVSALNESAGLPSTSPNPTDDRFDSKYKVFGSPYKQFVYDESVSGA
ncbi:MAG: hypothetical protein ACO3UU_10700, partial [Minisyncoccia bacterium]